MMLEIITAEITPKTKDTPVDPGNVKESPAVAQGIHEKTIELGGSEYDDLIVLFYNSFGSPFSCHDSHKGVEYTLAFVEKPIVVRQTTSNESRHYAVRVKLAKLPTAPGSGGPA